jgi:hypothetical protein
LVAAPSAQSQLLLVADCTHNSGKLTLENTVHLDTKGFQVVYVFPYPEPMMAFPANRDAS